MLYVALVTLLLIIQYMVFMALSGFARTKANIEAPAMTGDETYERASRVHVNTLEQLMITLPTMWVCAYFFRVDVAAALGLIFFVGRLIYSAAYRKNPPKRATGMVIGFLANVALVLSSFFGVITKLL